MGRKGFMMAEVVVVSTVIIIVLTSLYTSYVKIYGLFQERITYYDVASLYRLGSIRDYLIDINLINNYIKSTESVTPITNGVASNEKVFWIKLKNKFIDNEIINNTKFNSINKTYKDYLNYLQTSGAFKTNNIMIIENCENADKCNYAYLEIYSNNLE